MPAGKYNIKAEQGATFRRVFTWKDSDNNPIDLTGYTAKMQVREDAYTSVILDMSTANGKIVIATPANGQLEVSETASNMSLIDGGSYRYDIELTNGAEVTRLLEGGFYVSEEITS
jgi:hypothetical protein